MIINEQEKSPKMPTAVLSEVILPDIPDISKKVFLFDIDGVLCHPQEPISEVMLTAINRLSLYNLIYIVTGNSFVRAIDLIYRVVFDGIFCNNADEFRTKGGRLLWTEGGIQPIPPRIENTLQMLLGADDNHFGNRIEWRTPRFINFSRCGRFASPAQRESCDVSWREDAVGLIHALYPDVVAVMGGKVSIDIYSKGADKARAALWINTFLNHNFVFVGDKTNPGGNDYPIVEYCVRHPENIALTSFGPEYTLLMIDKFLRQVG